MTARPPRHSLRIKCPPYGVIAVIAWGEEGWATYRRQVLAAGFEDPGPDFEDDRNGECMGSCIWLLEQSPSTLVHETRHLVYNMFEHLRVDDEESAAYLQAWVFKKVVSAWGGA